MELNRVAMTMLTPKFTLDKCIEFQHRFQNRTVSRENFLRANSDTPNIDEQIEAGIIHAMSNPRNDGMRACGYLERQGDKVAREKAESAAAANATKKVGGNKGMTSSKRKGAEPESAVVWKAVRLARECFKFVHDHRSTLEPRYKTLFTTPILVAIKDVDPRGTKVKENRKIARMDQGSILAEIDDISKAMAAFPQWYRSKVSRDSKVRKGEVIMYELWRT